MRINGPLTGLGGGGGVSEVDSRLGREMALVSAFLYGSGATLVVASLLVPHWAEVDIALLLGVVALAYTGTVAHLAVARWWRPQPMAWFSIAAMAGTVLIGVVVVAGGPVAAGTYAILYVYVSAFAFYYFTLRMALLQVTVVGVTFAIALSMLGHHAAPAQWTVVVGAAVAAGGIIGVLGRRARELYTSEARAAARLREVDAMKSLFLQATSHELRTPLTAVKGGAETLARLDTVMTSQARVEIAHRVVVNASRLERLVDELLEVGSLGPGGTSARQPVRLDLLVAQVVEQHGKADGRVAIDTQQAVIDANPVKIERAVFALIDNALKHTPPASAVTVQVSNEAHHATLIVDDEGPGIPDERKERAFAPLEQGPNSAGLPQPGVGLGLALTARYVQMHGGRVGLEDRPGGGLRVRVVLPLAHTLDRRPEAAIGASAVDGHPAAHGHRVARPQEEADGQDSGDTR